MGLFNFLFRKKEKDKSNESRKGGDVIDAKFSEFGEWLEISNIGFFGQFKKSGSGEWIVAWHDMHLTKKSDGGQEKKSGSYLLYNSKINKVIMWSQDIMRPQRGSISDTGIFLIEDWSDEHISGRYELKSSVHVFSQDGKKLITRIFSANLFNSKISPNGKFAICQTCNSPSEDGNKLTLLDIENKKELFSIDSEIGWGEDYKFDEGNRELIIEIKNVGWFRYGFDGKFLDYDKFSAGRLNSACYVEIILEAQNILSRDDVNDEAAREIISSIDKAISIGAKENRSWYPQALKAKGMAYEQLGNINEALKYFEEALLVDTKIGLKRKITSLKKKINRE